MSRTGLLAFLVVPLLVGCSPATPTASQGPSPTPTATATKPTAADASQWIVEKMADDGPSSVLVLVTPELYEPLAQELAILEEDMRNESWHPVTSVMPSTTAEELRASLQTIYAQKPFAGVFLVGSFPFLNTWGYPIDSPEQVGPADYYYMDLDGEWRDTNGDGFVDYLKNGAGDRDPEIFVGRLNARNVSIVGESEVSLMRSYFAHNHAYRTGGLATEDAAIYATHAHHHYGRYDPASASWSQTEIDHTIGLFPQTYVFIFDDEAAIDVNEWPADFWLVSSPGDRSVVPARQEFLSVMGAGYDYLSIGMHGWHRGWGSLFTVEDVASVRDSGGRLPVFVTSSSCSTGDISKEDDLGSTLTLSGTLVFFGFAASSEMTWEENVIWIQSLTELPVGRAYLALQVFSTTSDDGPVPRNANWILLGDPTLRVRATATE